jgi:hypothetical protein
MNPTSNTPNGSPALGQPQFGTSTTTPTPPAGAQDYTQKVSDGIQAVLDSGKQTLDSSKKWLDDSDLADKAKELPQKAKVLGNQALSTINGLTTTQKVVGVSLLTAGIAFLITRKAKKKREDGEYRLKDRRSPFAKKSKGAPDDRGPRAQQRPWGSSRYGSAAAPATGKGRVVAGSGPRHEHPDHQRDHGQRSTPPAPGQRRDQGPASGSRYDAGTSGSQNPNTLDQLNSAF